MTDNKYGPDFIIIGAQRCGTTSLYNHLVKNRRIAPAMQKEVHFFDINYRKGFDWYRTQFPSLREQAGITGEASPYYLFHPHAPRRVFEMIPWVRLIVLLRNPVDRAISHYHHEVRRGVEPLSFEDALEQEEERLGSEIERLSHDQTYYSFKHQHFSYLSRGIYVDQLRSWSGLFPKEQILVIKSEDLYQHSSSVIKQVIDFLRLPMPTCKAAVLRVIDSVRTLATRNAFKNYNSAVYPAIDTGLRRRLAEYYAPHNKRLYDLLCVNFGWDS